MLPIKIWNVFFIFSLLPNHAITTAWDVGIDSTVSDGEANLQKRDMRRYERKGDDNDDGDSGRLEINFEVKRVNRLLEDQEMTLGFNVTGSCETGTKLKIASRDMDIAKVVSTA